jgi:hypothetical protein
MGSADHQANLVRNAILPRLSSDPSQARFCISTTRRQSLEQRVGRSFAKL